MYNINIVIEMLLLISIYNRNVHDATETRLPNTTIYIALRFGFLCYKTGTL
jgi:hypothetical protein